MARHGVVASVRNRGSAERRLPVAGLLVLGLACGGIAAPSALAVSGGAQVPVQDVEALSNPSTYSSVDIRSLLSAGKRQDGRDVSFTARPSDRPLSLMPTMCGST